jgi:hypothetical protein
MERLDLTPKNLLLTAREVGGFILAQLKGGAWAELSDLDSEVQQTVETEES